MCVIVQPDNKYSDLNVKEDELISIKIKIIFMRFFHWLKKLISWHVLSQSLWIIKPIVTCSQVFSGAQGQLSALVLRQGWLTSYQRPLLVANWKPLL